MAEITSEYKMTLSREAWDTHVVRDLGNGRIEICWREPYFDLPRSKPSSERTVHLAKSTAPPPTIEGGVIRGLSIVPGPTTTVPAVHVQEPKLPPYHPFGNKPDGPGWVFSSLLGWHKAYVGDDAGDPGDEANNA